MSKDKLAAIMSGKRNFSYWSHKLAPILHCLLQWLRTEERMTMETDWVERCLWVLLAISVLLILFAESL